MSPSSDCARCEDLLSALEGMVRVADELMTEFVSKKRAADWGVINDNMVAAGRAIRDAKVKSQ